MEGQYWLVADTWATGMRVWGSDDCLNWKPQDETLPGNYGDVVASGGELLPGGPAKPPYIDLKAEREAER